MGLIANVLSHKDMRDKRVDTTLNGWSSRFVTCCITNADGPFHPSPSCPAVRLVAVNLCGFTVVHAIAEDDLASDKWTMFGGNYVDCSDSRFGELVEKLCGVKMRVAIPIHDRAEGQR
jgi:hypothetical protein